VNDAVLAPGRARDHGLERLTGIVTSSARLRSRRRACTGKGIDALLPKRGDSPKKHAHSNVGPGHTAASCRIVRVSGPHTVIFRPRGGSYGISVLPRDANGRGNEDRTSEARRVGSRPTTRVGETDKLVQLCKAK
jgi:hypothetical protein